MKATLLILSLLLISCGARKSSLQKQSEKIEASADQNTKAKSEMKSEKSGETSYNLASDFMGFNIEPVNGIPAVFSFNYNGQKITGETSGKLNFSNEKKTEDIRTRYTDIINTTYVTETNYKTRTTYKKDTKNKDTQREAYPWYIIYGLGFISCVLLIILWKWLKSSQWYLNILDNFKFGA